MEIELDITREQLFEQLGEPDFIGNISRKYKIPMVYKYGELEYYFGPLKTDGLTMIMDSNTHEKIKCK